MTNYRIVVRHVRYWRGLPHKWSTVYPFVGTITSGNYGAAIAAIKTMEQSVCYALTGPVEGGIWEIALYNQSSGGVPQDIVTYFDPDTPGSWVAYTGSAWSAASEQLVPAAEVALGVRWAAGLSSSGKPVFFRKWYHAVPQVATAGATPDVSSANITTLVAALTTGINAVGGLGAPMGSGGRLAALTPVVSPFYENHQMPRGRRRKALVTAGGKYTGPSIQVPGEAPVIAD